MREFTSSWIFLKQKALCLVSDIVHIKCPNTANRFNFFSFSGVVGTLMGSTFLQGAPKKVPGITREPHFSKWRLARIGENTNFCNFWPRDMHDSSKESY